MPVLFSKNDSSLASIHEQLARITSHAVAPPSLEHLADFLETAFWASLEVNEGRTTRVCIVLNLDQKMCAGASFAQPVPYDEAQISKLAPAVPRSGCLVVQWGEGALCIRGFAPSRPDPLCGVLVLDVWEPGVVRVGVGPYPVFAVLDGRSNRVIESRSSNFPRYLQRLLAKGAQGECIDESKVCWRECRAAADLARAIVAEGHGGIVLIVPEERGPWEASLCPFAYRFAAPDTTIGDAIRRKLAQERDRADALQKLFTEESADGLEECLRGTLTPLPADVLGSVQGIATLAGADGAIVLTRDLAVLGFGAKIAVRDNVPPASVMFRSVPGDRNARVAPFEDMGGTRHQSSARFVCAHRDCVALVVSQDRHLSVLHWDAQQNALCVLRNAEWWV